MDKHAIELSGAAKYGPYSAGVEAGDMFWLSGQIAVDFDGTLCEYAFPNIGTQTKEQKKQKEDLLFVLGHNKVALKQKT